MSRKHLVEWQLWFASASVRFMWADSIRMNVKKCTEVAWERTSLSNLFFVTDRRIERFASIARFRGGHPRNSQRDPARGTEALDLENS